MRRQKFEIVPLRSIGPVHLGMSQDQSRSAFDVDPVNYEKVIGSGVFVDAYFESSFQVYFSKTDMLVEFIELSKTPEHMVCLGTIDIFGTPADELVTRITKATKSQAESPDGGYSYLYRSLELSLWRPVIPSDDEEGKYFKTVGIGVSGYGDDAV